MCVCLIKSQFQHLNWKEKDFWIKLCGMEIQSQIT